MIEKRLKEESKCLKKFMIYAMYCINVNFLLEINLNNHKLKHINNKYYIIAKM